MEKVVELYKNSTKHKNKSVRIVLMVIRSFVVKHHDFIQIMPQ